jgi:NAD(P)-dependent dehydrogenase (short-subunit alcohol dehydrogenase family)
MSTDPGPAPRDLRDRVAIVTGGASGLGAATCLALAEAGAQVVVADVDEAGGEAIAERVGGAFRRTDVSDLDENRALAAFALEAYGAIDLVHLNAGITTGCGLDESFDLERYRRAMGVNLDGVVFGVHAVLPHLRGRDGAIVATASLAGLTGVPYDPVYAANKHGVVGLVRSLGPALGGDGVRINAVCPGFADTPIVDDIRPGLEQAGMPLIDPQVVAQTVVHLFSSDATGEAWFVQPGREPAAFAFRNIPGPRGTS